MSYNLWQVLVCISLALICLELILLRRQVEKCLRILYEAAEADHEGGVWQ